MSKKLLTVLVLFVFVVADLYPQIKIENYKQDNSTIKFDLSITPVSKSIQNTFKGNTRLSFGNYFDESKPGNYALPTRELIIALPAYSKVNVKVSPLVENRIKGQPVVNPSIRLQNDSTLKYISADLRLSKRNNNPLFEIKGYLWIRNYYCVDIKIHQYRYNNSNIISELKKLKIILRINNPQNSIPANTKSNDEKFSKSLENIIANYSQAQPLNKNFYTNLKSNDDWINFNDTYLKIGVANDGIYRISESDLASYGITTSAINPKTFKLYIKGKELPIYVRGENDNSFDAGDYIEFFGIKNWGHKYRETSSAGESYNEYLNRYSDTTIYWLTWSGPNGLRTDTVSTFTGIPVDTLKYYSKIVHYEENLYLDYSIPSLVDRQQPDWMQNETWVWGQQGVGTASRTFNVSDVYPGKITRAFFKVQDFASNISKNAHKIGLSINSDPAVYDSSAFDKYAQKVVEADFSSGLLNEGSNILKTISFPTAASLNSVEYDWYEVEYPRYLKAVNDSLKILFDDISVPGLKTIKITDVTTNDPNIYKYSGKIKKITNYLKIGNNVIFSDTVRKGDKYVLVPSSKVSTPKIYYKKIFDDLKSTSIQADYILITHPVFLSKAEEYVNFISSNYGVTTKVINVNDIYDQFNFGFFAPEPIKTFLQAANIYWKSPKPAYVFLVGDATYDYYGNKTKYFGSPATYNYVPSYGNPVSDNWYTMWDTTGSYIQQMYIGRIPVNSVAEFDHYFDKHEKHLSDPYDKFNKTYLLFSGGETNNTSELRELKSTNDFIQNNLIEPPPVGGIARHLYKTSNPVSNYGPFSDQEVAQYIGDGGLFISYIGHSGTQIWDNGINTIQQLKNNSGKGSLISDWGCSTGKFAEPDIKAFSELFIDDPDGQAIAYTGNTSLGFVSTATIFPKLFYSDILKKNITGIGQAHAMAQNDFIKNYGSSGVYKIFALCNTLLGDPIINLKVPQLPNLSINDSDVNPENNQIENIDDSQDSAGIIIKYKNLGRVDSSLFDISVKDFLNGNKILDKTFSKKLPEYKDSLLVYIPTRNKPGIHQIQISLDDAKQVTEISESDNSLNYDLNVVSSSVRPLVYSKSNLISNGKFVFLNPILKSNADSLLIEYADNPSFNNPGTIIKELDTIATKINLTGLVKGKRYWLKSRLYNPSSNFGGTISFVYSLLPGFKYSVNDSLSFSETKVQNLELKNSGIQLTPTREKLNLQSAGFYDGSYGLITLNGVNYVSNSNVGGYHIVVFDEITLKFDYEIYLDYYGNMSSYETNFIAAIDSIPNNKIIAIATSDEPAGGLTTGIKNKLKSIGSTLIDSVKFRNSWGIITRKNFTPGSVLEGWTKSYNGPVVLDTLLTSQSANGTLNTGLIGPAGEWGDLYIKSHIPEKSSINLLVIRKSSGGVIDSVQTKVAAGNYYLSGSDAKKYPYLNLNFEFNSEDTASLPLVNSIELGFKGTPELGTNYQLVNLDTDSVKIGSNIQLSFSVMNVGESAADSFMVKVDVVNQDNSQNEIYKDLVISLNSDQKKSFRINYTTKTTGHKYLKLEIDPDNRVTELFKDNNIYSIPFTVLPDTNHPDVKITFDNREIVDNDFVSSKPKIKIELVDPSLLPVTDTSSISFSLNNKVIYYAGNSQVNYKFNSGNPKMIVEYSPDLDDGEYTLALTAKNSLGNKSDVITKQFVVSSSPQILHLYNYPNPFSSETYFTFKLTQIPDELRIRIFTVAGRLIKEFTRHASDLNYDFNRIYWDGRDQDGDLVANGVYLYKAIITSAGKTQSLTQKLAIVR